MFSTKNIFILLITFFCFFTTSLFGQVAATDSGGEVIKMNSVVMVVPATKSNEDIRTVMDNNPDLRLAMTKMKEELERRGVKTVDFVAKMKAAQSNLAFTADAQTDFKSALIQNSGADIYFTLDLNIHIDSVQGTLARVDMNAFENQSGNNLGNKVGESKQVITTDVNRLIEQAISSAVEPFLSTVESRYHEMIADGRSVTIIIQMDENSEYDMDSEVGPENKSIGTLLEEFMEMNAYKNQYRLGGSSDILMSFDEVKIPFMDQVTGKNYNPNKFATEINKFLKEQGLQSSRNTKGSLIQIKIK